MSQPFHQRLRAVQRSVPDCTYRVDYGLSTIPRFLAQYEVDMDPDYQRGYVWSTDQKRAFVGAALQNHNTIPIFWFNSVGHRSEVIDGKQRLSAILGWLDNEYNAMCPCGETFWSGEVDEIGRRNIEMTVTLKMHFVRLSRPDVLRFYLALNSGGTVHGEKDLDKVRRAIRETEEAAPR